MAEWGSAKENQSVDDLRVKFNPKSCDPTSIIEPRTKF